METEISDMSNQIMARVEPKTREGSQGIFKTGIFKMPHNFISSKLELYNSSLAVRRNTVMGREIKRYNKIILSQI